MVSFERDSPCTRVRATARATGAMDSLVEDISRDQRTCPEVVRERSNTPLHGRSQADLS